MPSCSSSGCHGGAASNRNQVVIWSRQDFHSRSYATLTTRRSEVMAEALQLGAPTTNSRCTTCHAPFHNLPLRQRTPEVDPRAGVSCESCHGPGEDWLRSHTRPDFSHADRVAAGMHDLADLYVRANTCVACHQNIDAELLGVGHPELIFELDGQGVTQPKHWRESQHWHGAQGWLVGQAVAMREISWKLSKETSPQESAVARWRGLIWLLQSVGTIADLPSLSGIDANPKPESFSRARELSDRLARGAASLTWSPDLTKKCLSKLVARHEDFRDASVSRLTHARRAERLALGLDRLLSDLHTTNSSVESELNELFKAVQSLPDFKATDFGEHLARLKGKLDSAKLIP